MSFNDRFNDVEIEYSQHSSDLPWVWVRVDLTVVRPVLDAPNFPSTLKNLIWILYQFTFKLTLNERIEFANTMDVLRDLLVLT